jgi:hypothetical protein
MRVARIAPLLATFGLLVACKPHAPVVATAATPAPGPKAAEPAKPAFDFEALLKREAPPRAVTKLDAGVLSADVEATSAPQVTTEKGSLHVVIPTGTTSSIDCYVYDEPKDPASTMSRIIDEVKKTLDVRLFAPTDVFVAGENGALVAHAIYLADKDGAKAAGQLKLAFYNHPLVPTLCMHDEVGYADTFKRITKRFFETARRSDRELRGTPTSWEVSVVKLDGRPVGVDNRRSYTHAETHLSTSVTVSSTLYPRSAVACVPEDSVTTRTVDTSGQLLESVHVKASGAEIELNVDLKRVSPAHYTYSGTRSGKAISGKFETVDKLGLATDQMISSNVKRVLLTGKATSFRTEEYSPSIDPTAAVETLYEMESKEQRRVRVSFGPIKLSAVVDGDGQAEKVTGNVGSASLSVERLGAGGKR